MADKDPIAVLDKMIGSLEEKITKVVNKHSLRLTRITTKEHLSGPTGSNSVERRTGKLARSVQARKAKPEVGGVITGGMEVGERYAKVHIGRRGTTFTIRPRNRKFLTIPLAAAKTGAGVARAAATSGIWGPTFIAKGIIFGYSGGTKGTTGTRPKPLFVLKNQVRIPRRIDPQLDLLAKVRPEFIRDLKEVVKGASV